MTVLARVLPPDVVDHPVDLDERADLRDQDGHDGLLRASASSKGYPFRCARTGPRTLKRSMPGDAGHPGLGRSRFPKANLSLA